MKTVRIWLLLLLALLLPARGTVAATMLCDLDGAGGRTELSESQLMAEPHSMTSERSASHKEPCANQDGDSHGEQGKAGSDSCKMCSATCSFSVIGADIVSVEPSAMAAEMRSSNASSPPDCLSGRHERPPRTI